MSPSLFFDRDQKIWIGQPEALTRQAGTLTVLNASPTGTSCGLSRDRTSFFLPFSYHESKSPLEAKQKRRNEKRKEGKRSRKKKNLA
jgi:hypothetical protein